MYTAVRVWAFLLLSCVTVNAGLIADFDGYKSERELRKYLFDEYDKLVRPVMIPSNKINVSAGITPLSIREVDETNQLIVLDSWIKMNWNDEYLKWDPSKFGNVTVLRVPSTEVWRPDLSIYTAVPVENIFPRPLSQVLIYNDGTVFWVPPVTIKSRCPLFNRAPKNAIKCNIRMGSWTYSDKEMDVYLSSPEVDVSDFIDNNAEWKLMEARASRESKHYSCCKEAYPLLHFNVTLKRRKPFSENELLIPEDSGLDPVELGKMKKIIETD